MHSQIQIYISHLLCDSTNLSRIFSGCMCSVFHHTLYLSFKISSMLNNENTVHTVVSKAEHLLHQMQQITAKVMSHVRPLSFAMANCLKFASLALRRSYEANAANKVHKYQLASC